MHGERFSSVLLLTADSSRVQKSLTSESVRSSSRGSTGASAAIIQL